LDKQILDKKISTASITGEEELKDDAEEEKKDRQHVIPSLFSGNTQQERSMLSYN
jgi:hypothetical protein